MHFYLYTFQKKDFSDFNIETYGSAYAYAYAAGWQKQGDMAIISQGTWPKSGNMKRRLRASKWHKLEFSIFISY